MITLPVNYLGQLAYQILIDNGQLFSALADAFREEGALSAFHGRRLFILTDDHVAPLYEDKLRDALSGVSDTVVSYQLPAGESNKTLDHVRKVYSSLIDHHFDRHDLIFALGGGVTGDMTGFIAATYLRGIAFVQIPTTLLSQTDSSIGGKTGVDFDGYKNMVGAFYMPRLVYIHPDTLNTLPDRELSSGMAEVIKHGLIKDADYAAHLGDIRDAVFARQTDVLSDMIAASCRIKRDVVERDPHEKGERALLNFGHTIGHAIEKAYEFKLLHGECVSLGCVAASYLSMQRGLIGEEDYRKVRALFSRYGLPQSRPDIPFDEEILRLIRSDKKMNAGQIRFVLLHRIGDAFTADDVTDDEIRAAIDVLRTADHG